MLILSVLTWVALIAAFLRWGSFSIGERVQNPLYLFGIALLAIPLFGVCLFLGSLCLLILSEILYFCAKVILFI